MINLDKKQTYTVWVKSCGQKKTRVPMWKRAFFILCDEDLVLLTPHHASKSSTDQNSKKNDNHFHDEPLIKC